MRILITGGAGFIGSRLARRMRQDGHAVIVYDNLLVQVHGEQPHPDLPECETVWADVRDTERLVQAMKGVEAVYHLAAETGVGQSQYEIGRYVSGNTFGTATVLEAAVEAGVKQFVLSSSRAVYGEGQGRCSGCARELALAERADEMLAAGRWDASCPQCGDSLQPLPVNEDTPVQPTSVYGVTKLQQEQLAHTVGRTRGLPVTVLRFFNVYGPGQSLGNPYVGVLGTFYRRAVAGLPIEVYEDGRMLRDFVFVDDVVEALRRVLGDGRALNQTLNVGWGQPLTLLEMAREVVRALDSSSTIAVSGRYRLGDVRHTVACVARLREQLGFAPQTSFREGLNAYVAWAQAQKTAAVADDARAEAQLTERKLLRQAR